MPRALLPWLAPTPAPSAPAPAPVQEQARVDRWVAPTPEVVVARKTNVRRAHAARTSRKPRGGDRHAADAPATLDLVVEQPDVTVEQPEACEGPLAGEADLESEFSSSAGAVPSVADTYSEEEIAAAVDEILEPARVVEAVTAPPTIDVIALLAKNDGERADLRADQALPPRFVVLGPKGAVLARFHGCEHATHCNHTIGGRGVIRLEDGKPMTGREP